MNLSALLTACRGALWGRNDWAGGVDISAKGLRESFLAIALSIPAYYICALAISAERASLSGQEKQLIPAALFALLTMIYSLTFSASAYIICAAFNKRDTLAPWVIVRHWALFFCVLLAAIFYGLSLLGALPFVIANYLALGIYLATLAIDIRLAQKIAGFELTAAIFTACIIFAMGLSVLLIGVVQLGNAA